MLPIAILVSYPFMCTSIQRGNVVVLVALLLSLAWLWMDSESKIKNELALIFIAISAGFKLYPALIGIVYLKRKEWKKAFRLVIYGVVVIFFPFSLYGGYEGAIHLFHTLTGFASFIDPDKTNTVCGMAKWLGLKLNMTDMNANTFGIVINYAFLVVSLVTFFLSKRKWQEALLLNGILVSFLPSNWQYTLVYYLSSLFLFMKEYDEHLVKYGKKTIIWLIIHIVGFGLVFSVDFFMIYYRYGLVSGIFTITYFLIGVNMVNAIWEWVKSKKSHLQVLDFLYKEESV